MRNIDTGGCGGDVRWTTVGGSMLRLSCALAMLGVRQAGNLFERRPESANGVRRPAPLSASPVEAVLNAAEEEFGGAWRGVYRVGREYLPGGGKARR